MKYKKGFGSYLFDLVNSIFLMSLGLLCVLPFVHLFSLSLSVNTSATAGEVGLIPVGFTLKAYEYVISNAAFLKAFIISLERVVLSLAISMLVVVMTAYPLSKEVTRFSARTAYTWIFVFTMFFSGGLIPTFIVVKYTGIINTIWALVLPGAVSAYNIVLLLNFFRGIPKELEEAAIIDGANQYKILYKIYVPVSKPALATIALFIIVGNWNSWFDGLIYMNSSDKYPLQSYLQTLVITPNLRFVTEADLQRLKNLSQITLKAAQIFLGAFPILVAYPFLQKYFVKGIVLGSVKG